MSSADAGRTLPPDPSVPGLWWLHRKGRVGWSGWTTAEWDASLKVWMLAGYPMHPHTAHAAGWRCITEAVPPEGAQPSGSRAGLEELRHRIKLAVAALNQAPDLPDGRVTRAQADAMRLANVLAWTFLTDGQDPPSKRRASEAPETPSDAA